MQTSSLPALHTLWIGKSLGPLERLCLTSWVRQGHRVALHAYNRLDTPEGIDLIDADKLIPKDKIFRHQRTNSLAPFSDAFRVAIMRAHDAVWLDSDIFLLKPFAFEAPNLISAEGAPGNCVVDNAAMRLAPDHPILEEIWRRYQHPWTALSLRRPRKLWPVLRQALFAGGLGPEHLHWGALGRGAIEAVMQRQRFDGVILGPENSLTPRTAPLFEPIADVDAMLAQGVVYVHLFRSSLQVDLAHPQPGSVYAELWRRSDLTPGAREERIAA